MRANFGEGYPRIVFDDIDFALPFCYVKRELNKPVNIIQTSIITGQRDLVRLGKFHKFEINVFRVEKSDWLNVYKNLLGKEILFYPFSDNTGWNFQALVKKVKPYFRNSTIYRDAVLLEIISKSPNEAVIFKPV